MRILFVTIFLLFAVAAGASAQNPEPERFLHPVKANNATQQKLLDMIRAHKRGDMRDAARIQRALAAYYTDKGEMNYAKICEQRAVAAESALNSSTEQTARGAATPRQYGEVPSPQYGSVPTPTYGYVKTPTYGYVKAPTYGYAKAPAYGDAKAPTYGGVKPDAPEAATETAPAPERRVGASTSSSPETPASGQGTGALNARYYYMDGGVLHTWDFSANGTYLHTEIVRGAGFSGRRSERGTYAIKGNMLEVHATKHTDATASGVTGGKTNALTAGTDNESKTHSYRITLLGPGGKEGMVLDGIRMKVKTW